MSWSDVQDNIRQVLAKTGVPHDGVQFHEYCQKDMEGQYPVLSQDLLNNPCMRSTKDLRSGKYSLAWGFHNEAVNMWYQSLSHDRKYDYVWIMEDDVGFSSNWMDFFEIYAGSQVDLLTYDTLAMCPKWWWADMVIGMMMNID